MGTFLLSCSEHILSWSPIHKSTFKTLRLALQTSVHLPVCTADSCYLQIAVWIHVLSGWFPAVLGVHDATMHGNGAYRCSIAVAMTCKYQCKMWLGLIYESVGIHLEKETYFNILTVTWTSSSTNYFPTSTLFGHGQVGSMISRRPFRTIDKSTKTYLNFSRNCIMAAFKRDSKWNYSCKLQLGDSLSVWQKLHNIQFRSAILRTANFLL